MLTLLLNTPPAGGPQIPRLTFFAGSVTTVFKAEDKPDPFTAESVDKSFNAPAKPAPIKAASANKIFRAKGDKGTA